MFGLSHKYSDISVQKLSMNLALQLYALLLLLPNLIYGFLSLEALYRPQNVVLHQVNIF